MKIAFRVDASSAIGMGHLMRSIALAQAVRALGGEPHFLCAERWVPLEAILQSEGFPVTYLDVASGSLQDGQATAGHVEALAAPWVLVDGYGFEAGFLGHLHERPFRVLLVDDYAQAGCALATLVLNPNVYADPSIYIGLGLDGRLLLGPGYALLRERFLAASPTGRRIPKQAQRLLVTLGGAAPEALLEKVFRRLVALPGLAIRGVIGGAPGNLAALQTLGGCSSLELLTNIDNMPTMMNWADLALTAGGGTCLEAAYMGLPSLMIALAENQRAVVDAFAAKGVGKDLGWHEALDMEALATAVAALASNMNQRNTMSAHGRSLVDGKGAVRVAVMLSEAKLALKPAGLEDSRLIWEWANDPVTRSLSFSSEPIPWEDHVAWYGRKLADPGAHLFLGVDAARGPVGQIRFDKKGEVGTTISIVVGSQHRGQGYGSLLIKEGVRQMQALGAAGDFHAWVKVDNLGSNALFNNCGFRIIETKALNNIESHHYQLGTE